MALAARSSTFAAIAAPASRPSRSVVVRASAAQINPSIRKGEEKVVDTLKVSECAKKVR